MGCVVRVLVALVVLGSLLAAVVAVQSRTWPSEFDRPAVTDVVIAGTDAALSRVGEVTARALGWGWAHLSAVPWNRIPDAVGPLTRGVLARITAAAASLTRTDSGEPLGAGRVTMYAAAWMLVLLVVVWLALRWLMRWSRGVWQCAAARRASGRRSRSTAKTSSA